MGAKRDIANLQREKAELQAALTDLQTRFLDMAVVFRELQVKDDNRRTMAFILLNDCRKIRSWEDVKKLKALAVATLGEYVVTITDED